MALLKDKMHHKKILDIITEDINVLFFIVDQDLLISHINEEKHKEILGFTQSEIVEHNFLDLIQESEKERISDILKNIQKEEKVKLFLPLKTKISDSLILKSSISYIDKNDPDNMILIICYISEGKSGYNQNHLRILFESLRDIIFVVKYTGKIVTFNTIAIKKLKFSEKELLNMKFIDLHPPKTHNKVENLLDDIFCSKRDSYSIPLITKDKEKIPVEIMVTRGLWNNEPVFFGICRDISERLEYERLIEEELKKLKELDKIRKDLISRVSHELKTPLMSIRGATELIMEFHNNLSEDMLELMHIIDKGETRLEYLVNNLLDISRIQYKKLKIKKKPTNLSTIIENSSIEMVNLIQKRDVNLNIEIPDKLIINIDNERIEQVLKNIISNAVKNTPPGGNIKISIGRAGEYAEILVKDDGVGLTSSEKKKLFKRFGKIERYEEGLEYLNIQGSGLGLYISKKIVELHNGSISAQSEGRNEGATFKIKLPIE